MKILKRSVIAIFLYLCISSFVCSEYAQAWVFGSDLLTIEELPYVAKSQIKPKCVSLILLTKDSLFSIPISYNPINEPPIFNNYLKCFLINSTDTGFIVHRADATVIDISSEVMVNGVWKSFQHGIPVRCGNSYWDQKLESHKALSILYDHNEKGNIKLPFRIKYANINELIYSNEIEISVNQYDYDRVLKLKN